MLVIGLGTAHAGTYADWVQAHNLPSNASDPTNAPAGDGIPNLLKFAMGLDPNTPGPDPLFQPVLVQQNGQALFGVNLSLDSTAQGVRLNLYALPDLRTWSPAGSCCKKWPIWVGDAERSDAQPRIEPRFGTVVPAAWGRANPIRAIHHLPARACFDEWRRYQRGDAYRARDGFAARWAGTQRAGRSIHQPPNQHDQLCADHRAQLPFLRQSDHTANPDRERWSVGQPAHDGDRASEPFEQ